jgi:hypothetical protein
MMTLLRNNLVSVVSGVLLLLLVGFGVWNMSSKKVQAKMQQITGAAGQLASLAGSPKNEAVIEAAQKRADALKQQIEQGEAAVRQINGHQPLMEGVFPTPTSETRRFEFKAEYTKAIDQLVNVVAGGDLPGAPEIQEAEEEIAEIRELEREKEEGGDARPGIDEPREGGGAAQPPVTPGRGLGIGGTSVAGRSSTDTADPKYNPRLRAQVNRARNIRMYVSAVNRRSFHVSPIIRQTTPPEVGAMWFAQVGLWLQQDIMSALAKVNDKAAAALPSDEEANVLNMPVKRLERIEILGYVLAGNKSLVFPRDAGDATAGGSGLGGPSALGATSTSGSLKSFTGRVSDNDFDVVRFEIWLIADQRDLPQIIDEITRTNFYQPIDCDFTQVDSRDQADGYYYGTEPSCRVRLVFEGYFARANYDPIMPEEVRKQFSAN